jgi:quinol monooxygenase YgiN
VSLTVIYNFNTKPGLRDQVIQAFSIVKGAAGLNSIQLYKDKKNPDKLVCVENWASEKHHDTFIGSFTPEQAAAFESMFTEKPEPGIYSMAV